MVNLAADTQVDILFYIICLHGIDHNYFTVSITYFVLGPVWNRGIKNVGMGENIGIGNECGGKTEEWKNTGNLHE